VDRFDQNEAYVYLAFCPKDAERMEPVICALRERGVRLLQNEETEENCVVAHHLKNAHAVLFFLSEEAIKAEQMVAKVDFAIRQKKVLVPVFLEEIQLPLGIQLRLAPLSSVHGYRCSAEELADLLVSLPFIKDCINKK